MYGIVPYTRAAVTEHATGLTATSGSDTHARLAQTDMTRAQHEQQRLQYVAFSRASENLTLW